jgi:hypothetical protein
MKQMDSDNEKEGLRSWFLSFDPGANGLDSVDPFFW